MIRAWSLIRIRSTQHCAGLPPENLMATDGFAFSHDAGNITDSLHRCVGVGKCRADTRADGGFMCPSYQATRDEGESTRGRARVLQEMLNGGVVELGWSSPEVHDALDLCLSCKACANDCPTGIDMAMFKSESLFQTYKGKIRPLTHYTFGRMPQWLSMAGRLGPLINQVARFRPITSLMMRIAGADPRRKLPSFPAKPFRMLNAAPVVADAVGPIDSAEAWPTPRGPVGGFIHRCHGPGYRPGCVEGASSCRMLGRAFRAWGLLWADLDYYGSAQGSKVQIDEIAGYFASASCRGEDDHRAGTVLHCCLALGSA